MELRRQHERGEPVPPNAYFRELSRRFPGCLNELDRLPIHELERRALACREAASGAEPAAWMEWLGEYHALLRCAHAVRHALGPQRPGARGAAFADQRLETLAEELDSREQLGIDAGLLRRLVSPADGRTVGVVLEELARRHSVDRETLERAILSRRRRS